MARILVVVDITSLYLKTSEKHGPKAHIDYGKILNLASDSGDVVGQYAYGSFVSGASRPFLDYLRRRKFALTVKEAIPATGNTFRKANYCVEVCIDVMDRINDFDSLTLCTSDPELIPLVRYCIKSGKRVFLLGCNIPSNLSEAASDACEIPQSFLYQKEP